MGCFGDVLYGQLLGLASKQLNLANRSKCSPVTYRYHNQKNPKPGMFPYNLQPENGANSFNSSGIISAILTERTALTVTKPTVSK